ncbi:hypothetical protein EVAR_51563_1 [Eumeta japonica]|uniref:Uncharacterized protein n=1 Tax=Eumeta variegata TaxID=151549 RepID=A0A4C1YEB6_EUMVA|nr:hypothetical protein EVAR_51563_1 [Eumeta japonica]
MQFAVRRSTLQRRSVKARVGRLRNRPRRRGRRAPPGRLTDTTRESLYTPTAAQRWRVSTSNRKETRFGFTANEPIEVFNSGATVRRVLRRSGLYVAPDVVNLVIAMIVSSPRVAQAVKEVMSPPAGPA